MKSIFLSTIFFSTLQLVLAQYPRESETVPTPTNQGAGTYSVRYKGLRCNKSQERDGDELTIYFMGLSANARVSDAMSLPADSVMYDDVKKGSIQTAPIATVFTGKLNEEVSIFCAILERDAEESAKKHNTLSRAAGFMRDVARQGADVHSLYNKQPTVAPPLNQQQDLAGTQSSYPNTDQTLNGNQNNLNQPLSISVPPSDMSVTQKALITADKAAFLTTDFLALKSAKRGDIIEKVFFPLEKIDINQYLKAERKLEDNIKYHFILKIKNKKADYDVFFEVIANE
jgi:hypothetical protein